MRFFCNASRIALRCVLKQNWKVIYYASRKIKINEKKYSTNDLDLTTVVFCLKNWRNYLYGVYVDVFPDHESLQNIFKQKNQLSPT